MENLKDVLENYEKEIDNVTNDDALKKIFRDIANNLFKDFCIECGDKKYCFAEIEFYYYDKNKFNKEWNRETYPRTDKVAGELFFHYSGIDICFNSNFNKGRFGGILIRSLRDIGNQCFITGPTVCSNEILNTCSKNRKWPEIVYKKDIGIDSIIDEPIKRYGLEDELLCFYDKDLSSHCSNNYLNWDFDKKNECKNPGAISKPRSYKKRFKTK